MCVCMRVCVGSIMFLHVRVCVGSMCVFVCACPEPVQCCVGIYFL